MKDDKLKYIGYTAAHKTFRIRKNKKYYGSFRNLSDAIKARKWLMENNWDKEGLKKIISNRYKHYHKQDNSYVITKRFGNVSITFARCKTEEEAKKTVELLKKINWDKEKFEKINELNPSFVEEMGEIEKEKDIKIENINELFDENGDKL